jgi:hypothetical protein
MRHDFALVHGATALFIYSGRSSRCCTEFPVFFVSFSREQNLGRCCNKDGLDGAPDTACQIQVLVGIDIIKRTGC